MSDTTVIEINGVKLEVDLREARRVENVKVGSRVKVLRKKDGYNSARVYTGVVIGFEPFEALPTILVCYVDLSYSAAELKFLAFNAATEDHELIVSHDEALFEREEVMKLFDRQRIELEAKLADLAQRRAYFERHFGQYWAAVQLPEAQP